jgi:CBS-domain-containing membrane protein
MNAVVKDVMTTHVVAVEMATSFKELAAWLREYRVSAFPVVDREGRVVGVVSEADRRFPGRPSASRTPA